MVIWSYPYRPKLWVVTSALILCGGSAPIMGRSAWLNDRDLIITILSQPIHLDPSAATVFLWCVTALLIALAMFGLFGIYLRFFSTKRVTLTDTEISAFPSIYARTPTIVKLADVRDVSISGGHRYDFLTIRHANGKLVITSINLPNRNALEKLRASIALRIAPREH